MPGRDEVRPLLRPRAGVECPGQPVRFDNAAAPDHMKEVIVVPVGTKAA